MFSDSGVFLSSGDSFLDSLPTRFEISQWSAFLPPWVIGMYRLVLASSMLNLNKNDQKEYLMSHHLIYEDQSVTFLSRSIHRFKRFSGGKIPLSRKESLNLLASLGLIYKDENGVLDVVHNIKYPEHVLNISFWQYRQLANLRYRRYFKGRLLDIFQQTSKSNRLSVLIDDLREILDLPNNHSLKYLLVRAEAEGWLRFRIDKTKNPNGVILFSFVEVTNGAAPKLKDEERQVMALFQGAVMEFSLSEIKRRVSLNKSVREILLNMEQKGLLFLDEPIASLSESERFFVEII